MQGQQMVSEGEDRSGTHWLPSTLCRGVCSNGQRSSFSLLQSLSTQFHLPCLPVLFPFPADTTSLPVSILLTGKFTYSSGGLHPFLHFFDVLLFIFPGYFICLCLLNFLVLPQDLILYPLLLSTKHLAHPGLVFQVGVLFSMSPLQHWILFSSCLTQMVSVSSQAMLGLKFIESMSIPLIC